MRHASLKGRGYFSAHPPNIDRYPCGHTGADVSSPIPVNCRHMSQDVCRFLRKIGIHDGRISDRVYATQERWEDASRDLSTGLRMDPSDVRHLTRQNLLSCASKEVACPMTWQGEVILSYELRALFQAGAI